MTLVKYENEYYSGRSSHFFQNGGQEFLLGVTLEGPKWYYWILRVWFPISH